MKLSVSAIGQCIRQLWATELRLSLFLLKGWTSLSYSMLYFLMSSFSECIWQQSETKSLFELHHHSPKWHHCKSGTLHRYEVRYWPGLVRDDSTVAVALEIDSNTVDRSSSAEEIGAIVFAICKMVSGNFKRKERINKTYFSLLKQINLQRKTCADLSKVEISNSSASFLFVQMFQKRRVNWLLLKGQQHMFEGGKKIRNKAHSEWFSLLYALSALAIPQHYLIGVCVQTLLHQWVPPF